MARQPGQRQPPLDFTKPTGGDRIEERGPSGAWHWATILTWFMRIVAILWLLKGLGAWAIVLGAWSPAGAFEAGATSYQTITIYFAIIDLVAAVGLWMASTAGGVLWLLAVMSHLVLTVFFPGYIPGSPATFAFFGGLMVAYLALSFLAARAE